MKSREFVKFMAETRRNIGVGLVISSIVLFLSSSVKELNLIMLFAIEIYFIAFGGYIFLAYVREEE